MISEDREANGKARLIYILESISEAQIRAEIFSMDELFCEISAAIIHRDWFKSLWGSEEWQEIVEFDDLRRFIGAKYNKLPPAPKFWVTRDGVLFIEQATQTLAALRGV